MGERKRKPMVGYDENGIPRWLTHDMRVYGILKRSRGRVNRRLIRMLKIQRARSPWFDGANEYNDSVQSERIREERKELWALRRLVDLRTRERKMAREANEVLLRSVTQLTKENDDLRARLQPGSST